MPRKRSRKVLYEVSSEARKARKSRPKLEISKRAKAFTKKVTSGRKVNLKERSVVKPIGFKRNAIVIVGRLLNFSVKKALIVLAIFVAVVILLPDKDPIPPNSGNKVKTPPEKVTKEETGETGGETPIDPDTSEVGPNPVGPPKDHCIVIASHTDVDQLKALSGHFALNGIKTEIKLGSSMSTLITEERYLKPGDLQSGIKQAKAKIQEVGNKYKPQRDSGYLRFEFKGIYEQKVR
ncbi:MAG: hypothetical protein FVQ82_09075 [Planctomycetes bacterium]|nr:hypothetical protein [Planctomycetota bacterium]